MQENETFKDRRMDGCINGQAEGWTSKLMHSIWIVAYFPEMSEEIQKNETLEIAEQSDRQMNGSLDGWMDGCIDAWMDGITYEAVFICCRFI